MVKLLCSLTVCQVVTLRDVGFSWSKIQKQLNLNSRSSAQYAYKRYLKNKFRGPKVERKTPQIVKKKMSGSDVLKDPKTSLERIRVAHKAFSCYETISRGTFRRILKKNGVFFKKCCKECQCINMLKKPFSFWQNVVFTNETKVRISSDGIVSFSKKWNEIS